MGNRFMDLCNAIQDKILIDFFTYRGEVNIQSQIDTSQNFYKFYKANFTSRKKYDNIGMKGWI